ncbi:glycosyltransferase [Panacibacter sp. DH6]|uniref:Glycosyltransferase n=1 Tax=Panacibacter microcysteis TaxID=2793269 RepID=A0A931GUN6_9BACT|nr:glycosyltransferase [Panacibacter microcysteis]MBG9376856.1 glycosyltransferase [Panacibacter microcysteis]
MRLNFINNFFQSPSVNSGLVPKIKVAHVIRVFSYGGAEVLLREFFAQPEFKEQITSDLFVLDHKKLGLKDDVMPNINKFYFYKITTWKFFFEYLRFLKDIKKGNYDIVHMHLPVAGWMGVVAKLFTGKKTKYIYSEHNLVNFYSKYNYYLSGWTYGFFDSVIYVSHEVGEVIRKIQKGWFFKTNHPVTILNGIDTNKFHCTHRQQLSPAQTLTIGLVARFRPQKRVDRWAEVAAAVHKKNPAIKFLMVGDGPSDELLRQRIKELNVEGVIELPGMLTDTYAAYKRIDIFLLTSDFEGLPLALLEAMSCGCVPVISNVGGIKQLDFTGIGYKFDDFNPDAIADKIVAYTQNPDQYFVESDRSRDFVIKNYSLTKQVNEIIDLYRELGK